MALESVFAIPPPLVGTGNTETILKHGEKESSPDENSEASDGEGPPTLLPEEAEEGEIEEGEIVESGEEAPDLTDKADDGTAAGKPTEAAANEADASNDADASRKKKKKKKKRKPEAGDENTNGPEAQGQKDKKAKKPKLKKRYIDHDRVNEENPWFRRSPSHRRDVESPERSPRGLYDSPYESQEEEERPESEDFSGGKNNTGGSRRPPNYKKRLGGGAHGQPDRKRSRPSQFGQNKGGRRFRQSKGPSRAICRFFLDGMCSKGDDCSFLHEGAPPKKQEVCKFYVTGYCGKGDRCLFMHKEFPCKFFHRGHKCFSNEMCMFSHEPLTEETKRMLDRYMESYHSDEEGDFESPRPSLLGSPPRHIKEMAHRENMRQMGSPPRHMKEMESMRNMRSPPRHIKEMADRENMRKIPSLFDIKVGPPAQGPPPLSGSPNPHGGPVRPNFYNDTLKMSPMRMRFPLPGRRPPMPTNGPRPGCSPPRGNEGRFHRHHSPPKEDGVRSSTTESAAYEMSSKDVDMRQPQEPEDKTTRSNAKSEDEETDHSKSEDKGNSSDSDSESKRALPAVPIPSHLPKRQRELFMRIQQQQREAGSSQEDSDRNDAKKEEAKEENWYSSDESDDDDAGDQPIAAVLKKLQQQPPQSKTEKPNSQPTFDIAKMLGMIRTQAGQSPAHKSSDDPLVKESAKDQDMRLEARDPRMRRNTRQDPNPHNDKDSRVLPLSDPHRDPRLAPIKELGVDSTVKEVRGDHDGRGDLLSPRSGDAGRVLKAPSATPVEVWGNGDKDMRQLGEYLQNSGAELVESSASVTPMPYKLYSMTISQPNYNTIAIASQNNPKLLNDPRLQKPLTLPDIPLPLRPPAPAVNTSSNSSDSESGSKNSDPRTRRPSLNLNGLSSPPHIIGSPPPEPLLSPIIPTLRVDPRANSVKLDPRSSSTKPDPRSGVPKIDPRSTGLGPHLSAFPASSDPRSFAPNIDHRSGAPSLISRLVMPHDPNSNPDPRPTVTNFDPRQIAHSDPRGHPPKSDPRSSGPAADPRARHRIDPRLGKIQQPPSPPPPPPPSLPPPPPPSLPYPTTHPTVTSQPKAFAGRHVGLPTMPSPQPRERLTPHPAPTVLNASRASTTESTSSSKSMKRIERHKKNIETPKDEAAERKDAPPKPKGGSFQRRSSLDYASPLGYNDSDPSSSQPGYNSYSRRPQRTLPKPPPNAPAPKLTTLNSTPVPSPPSVKTSPRPELEVGQETNSNPTASEEDLFNAALNASLKDVFKTIDPTASPFC